MSNVKVRFQSIGYAYTAQILNAQLLADVLKVVTSHGGPDEPSVLMSWDDLTQTLNRRNLAELDKGWGVTQIMDSWEAAALYGYSAHDTLQSLGKL